MNAKEAKELSNTNKKDFNAVMETIESMAKSGNRYATIQIEKIRDPEEYKSKLIELGYSVDLTENYFSITW